MFETYWRAKGKRKTSRRAIVATVAAASLLSTLVVASPAHAVEFDTTPFRTVHEVRNEPVDPNKSNLGYATIWINTNAYQSRTTAQCKLTGSIQFSLANVVGNSKWNKGQLYSFFKAALADNPLPGPAGPWKEYDLPKSFGVKMQQTDTIVDANCSEVYSSGFTASPFWETSRGSAVLGVIGNLSYNALFIGTMLGLGFYFATYHPAFLTRTAVQVGVSVVSAAAATFTSTIITSRMNYNIAWTAALTSACITSFTEVPYLNAWQALIDRATRAHDLAGAFGDGLGNIGSVSYLANSLSAAGSTIFAFFANLNGGTITNAVGAMMNAWGYGNLEGTLNQVDRGTIQAVVNEVTDQENAGCANR